MPVPRERGRQADAHLSAFSRRGTSVLADMRESALRASTDFSLSLLTVRRHRCDSKYHSTPAKSLQASATCLRPATQLQQTLESRRKMNIPRARKIERLHRSAVRKFFWCKQNGFTNGKRSSSRLRQCRRTFIEEIHVHYIFIVCQLWGMQCCIVPIGNRAVRK